MKNTTWIQRKRGNYSKLLVDYPLQIFISVWITLFILTAVCGAKGWISPVEFTGYDFSVPSSTSSKQQDAYDYAIANSDASQLPQQIRSRTVSLTVLSLIYEWSDKNVEEDIFTAQNLKDICDLERILVGTDEFKKFCVTDFANGTSTVCSVTSLPMVSLQFYGLDEACVLLDQNQVDEVRERLLNNTQTVSFFDASVLEVELEAAVSPRSKSTFIAGGPLGIDTTEDKEFTRIPVTNADFNGVQAALYEEYMINLKDKLEDYLHLENTFFRSGYFNDLKFGESRQLRIRYSNQFFETEELLAIVVSDVRLLLFAIFLVGFLVYVHLRSVFLTVSSVFSILLSFPVGVFLMIGILGVDYFTFISFTAMYLILGIGADNIFIFFDQFEQAKILVNSQIHRPEMKHSEKMESGEGYWLEKSIAIALEHSARSIFITTMTTACAFFGAATYPVVPISGFGIFAGLVVLSNYMFLFLIYPTAAVIHEKYIKGPTFCCCCLSCMKEKERCERSLTTKSEAAVTSGNEQQVEVDTWEAYLVRTFYMPFMKKAYVPQLLLLLEAALLILFFSQAVQLEVPTKVLGNFSPGHMFRDVRDATSKLFAGASEDEFVDFQLTFGIKGVDRSGFKKYKPNGFRGTARFDLDFALHKEDTQRYFLQVCEDLRFLACDLDVCTYPDTDLAVVPGSVQCVLENFYEFVQEAEELDSLADAKLFAFELGSSDSIQFYSLLADFAETGLVDDSLGFFDGKLSYVTIKYKAALRTNRPVQEINDYLDLVFEFEDFVVASAPIELKSTIHTSAAREEATLTTAIISGLTVGLCISLSIALLVLLVTTNNYILATWAFGTILHIIISVLGTIKLYGYTLSIFETLTIIISSGVSIDYTCHLGLSYLLAGEAGKYNRAERFEEAARKMGPSIITGFLTTAVSISILLPAQAAFFARLGTLILTTVVYSIQASFFLFLPAMKLFGPEGDAGNILGLIHRIKEKISYKYCR
eukprot:augustus_masked-scaffold_15-processed-gene-4.6-mRNA-1 protein AED:1.00 eAED:1.00 QI:0/-1/0/0/-1/1/1/0/987